MKSYIIYSFVGQKWSTLFFSSTELFWCSSMIFLVSTVHSFLLLIFHFWVSVQFSSVPQSCPTPRDPMNCNTPGLPVHHQVLEFAQTHVHLVSDAIQPSHPLSSPSPPAPIPPSIRVFSNESTLCMKWPKYWFQLQHQSFQ